MTNDKYPMLVKISTALRFLGWASAVLGAVCFLIILIWGHAPQSPKIMSLVALIVGGVYFLLFYGIGEVMRVLMDIESNTRRSS